MSMKKYNLKKYKLIKNVIHGKMLFEKIIIQEKNFEKYEFQKTLIENKMLPSFCVIYKQKLTYQRNHEFYAQVDIFTNQSI